MILDEGLRISRAGIFAAGVAPDSSTPQIPALAPCREISPHQEKRTISNPSRGLLEDQGHFAKGRPREALVEAMGAAISAVSTRDASGFFEHCGYTTPVDRYITNALRAHAR